jgi:hypothetical protein
VQNEWRVRHVTELSTNKHQYLRGSGKWCKASGKSTPDYAQAQILILRTSLP